MPLAVKIILIVLAAFAGICLCYVLLLAVSSLFVDKNRIYMKHSRYYRGLLNSATHLAVWLLRIRIHTTGLEKIPQGTRFLLIQNHRSKFDPILSWYVLEKYDVAFLSKEENMHIPFFGKIIRRCCFMSIDRQHPAAAMKTVENAVALLKDDQVSMGVYPEGTRNTTDAPLLPFHNSMFKIAQMAEVPIVIMAVRGTSDIHKNFPRRGSDVYFDITGVLTAEEIKGVKTNAIGEQVIMQILDVISPKQM
ncbi:MAG: 1-acyl-sn-glycerol-3-phosphate acyltransferase [Lachnospiraceae bacterium]|nr:1-acyl-sn-glycerol-3-phosphate acyltransferase [Lachnospiraceae bacterium]